MQSREVEPPTRRPRVGHIDFLNCLPLYDGLARSGALSSLDLRRDTPDALSDALVRGDLDIGPVSVVECLRHADELLVFPDIAVGSDGPVHSVVLVSRVPLGDLDGQQVALGATSRTGALLAQLLLEDRDGVRPIYLTLPPHLPTMLDAAPAAVLIGDAALQARQEAARAGLHCHDLGAAWRQWTGLPMVFALWAVRRHFATARPDAVAEVQAAFARSLQTSLRDIDGLAARAAPAADLAVSELAAYFRVLDFSLGERQLEGLAEFARRAAARGAVPRDARLSFLGTTPD